MNLAAIENDRRERQRGGVLPDRGEKTEAARRLPEPWRHEFLNILATWSRRGGAPSADAQELWRRAVRWIGPCEVPVNMIAALALAHEHGISAYDAQYLARAATSDGESPVAAGISEGRRSGLGA